MLHMLYELCHSKQEIIKAAKRRFKCLLSEEKGFPTTLPFLHCLYK